MHAPVVVSLNRPVSRSDGSLLVCIVTKMDNMNTLYLVMDKNAADIGYDAPNVFTVTELQTPSDGFFQMEFGIELSRLRYGNTRQLVQEFSVYPIFLVTHWYFCFLFPVRSKPVDLEFQIGSVLNCFGGFFTRFVTSFNVGRSSVMVSVFPETDTIWGGFSRSV